MGACCASEMPGPQNERLEGVGKKEQKQKNAAGIGKNKNDVSFEINDVKAANDKKKGLMQSKKKQKKEWVVPAVAKELRKKVYALNSPIKLGYWKMRGVAMPIRFLLLYIDHPYTEEIYAQGDAPHFSVAEPLERLDKIGLDFPIMPYIIDGSTKLTDAHAIMQYLATMYAPELVGETPQQTGEIDMLYV